MQIDIKHKGSNTIEFTWYNTVSVKVVGENTLQVSRAREGKENLVVGSYNLADFDFEVIDNE